MIDLRKALGWPALAGVLSLAVLTVGLIVPAVAPAAKRQVTIKALYQGVSCPSGERNAMKRLPHAELVVRFGGRVIRTRLNRAGIAKLRVGGRTRKLRATVILDGKLLAVRPFSKGDPYRIPGSLTLPRKGTKVTRTFAIRERGPAGAAGAWSILSEGPELAKRASPVALSKVVARYEVGQRPPHGGGTDIPGRLSAYKNGQIWIDGRVPAAGEVGDEFEPWVLLHEYGHHVLGEVADPGPGRGGDHDYERSYPKQPTMAWSEGFAHAFAAVVLNDPVLGTQCRRGVNLSASPATPRSKDDPWLNQYHEISVAGAVWGLADYLGGGKAPSGLKPLLSALHAFHGKYGGPEGAREVRDALTEFANDNAVRQQRFGDIFDKQRLRWGFKAQVVDVSDPSSGRFVLGDLVLWTRGSMCAMGQPYSFTGPKDEAFTGPAVFDSRGVQVKEHGRVADTPIGPLDYTSHDECWLTVDGAYLSKQLQTLVQTYPYRATGAHRNGETTIYGVWDCGYSSSCPSQVRATFRIGTGVWHRPNGKTHIDSAAPLHSETVITALPAFRGGGPTPLSAAVPIARFDALGKCTTLAGVHRDCGS
jgi:hypothetical protein